MVNEDMMIQRVGGDELSLMTEIVIRRRNGFIFKKPKTNLTGSDKSPSIPTYSSQLSRIKEIQSEDQSSYKHGYSIRSNVDDIDECANVKFLDHIELTAERGFDNRPEDEEEHARLHREQEEH